jgi:hypothetical protein
MSIYKQRYVVERDRIATSLYNRSSFRSIVSKLALAMLGVDSGWKQSTLKNDWIQRLCSGVREGDDAFVDAVCKMVRDWVNDPKIAHIHAVMGGRKVYDMVSVFRPVILEYNDIERLRENTDGWYVAAARFLIAADFLGAYLDEIMQ